MSEISNPNLISLTVKTYIPILIAVLSNVKYYSMILYAFPFCSIMYFQELKLFGSKEEL